MRWLVPVATIALLSSSALASSHREAPFITKNPKVDGTDFYLFNSYQALRTNFVTLIANYQPLQDPYGGPNYFSMDPEALYEIHVDNNGDAVEDITFQFKFQNTLANGGLGVPLTIAQPDGGASASVPISLINAFPIGYADGGFDRIGTGQGQLETFTVGVVRGPRRATAASAVSKMVGGATTFEKPIDNVGAKTFPGNSYANYAASFVYDVTIPGCAVPAKIFVGQRKESFAVNLGTIFDLINAPGAVITNNANRAALPNPIGGKNVTTIAVEVDKTCLLPTTGTNTVIGGWTTASVRQARVTSPSPTYGAPTREGGPWVQVSRLGMPLVNEVVIGLPDKNKFNASEPKDDAANFAPYVTNPWLPTVIELLFTTPAPRVFPRTDLIATFLTGVTGVNAVAGSTVLAEMIRLNTALPATASGAQNNFGAFQCFTGRTATAGPVLTTTGNPLCDVGGFPNGRRPGDDVVDVTLRVAMGALQGTNDAPSAAIDFHDAVLQDESQFDATFPYLKLPNPGT